MKNNMHAMDFELLKAHAIKKPKEFLYSHPEYHLSIWERLKLKYFVFLRQKGYSVAAITKHKEFYGLDFFVNKHTLIPRPDTELMVAEAIKEIKDDKTILIDVGTGSGCIPISILKNLPYPTTTYAIDISASALKVAEKNARTHNVNIEFFHGNLLKPVVHKMIHHKSKIIITANLPYLTEKQFRDEPSIQREPKNALVADNNGLALYEELLQQIKSQALNATVFLEIDPLQSEEITQLITKYLPQSKIEIGASPHISIAHSEEKKDFSLHSFRLEIKKDLSGLDRLVKIF